MRRGKWVARWGSKRGLVRPGGERKVGRVPILAGANSARRAALSVGEHWEATCRKWL
jgi:hypothetical protein